MTERLAKIVCTLGPASSAEGIIEQMARAGMDVARLNFSHGTHAEHGQLIERVRSVEARLAKPIAILQDLQGPKIRLGSFENGTATLRRGRSFVLTTAAVRGSADRASITYGGFARDVKAGDRVLIDDGRIALEVEDVRGEDVVCRVETGGVVQDHKGVNLPATAVRMAILTQKDREDLAFGLQHGVDYVGVSFVRSAADLLEVREVINEHGSDAQVVAKLERPEALGRLDAILGATSAVMVARGDLGVEMPLEEVPVAQKEIIRKARLAPHAGHHGDPDAGVDGLGAATDPGRGLRRGQRDPGRDRRGDALGGVGDRGVSGGGGADPRPGHPADRGRVPRRRTWTGRGAARCRSPRRSRTPRRSPPGS